MPATHQLICLVVCFVARTVLAEQESSTGTCIGHTLTPEQVKEQLFVGSRATFATWGVETIELAPCLSDDGVAAQIVLTLPKGWSSLGVSYRLRVSSRFDPKTGKPTGSTKNSMLQTIPATIKRLLPRIEREESVRSFVERYQPLLVWIEPDTSRENLRFDFQSINAHKSIGAQLLLQDNVPGFVVGYRLSHIDGLPVRRELLRFAELVSIQQPRCMIQDIYALRQESPIDDNKKKIVWSIDAKLRGKECRSPIGLTVDENGNTAPDSDN